MGNLVSVRAPHSEVTWMHDGSYRVMCECGWLSIGIPNMNGVQEVLDDWRRHQLIERLSRVSGASTSTVRL